MLQVLVRKPKRNEVGVDACVAMPYGGALMAGIRSLQAVSIAAVLFSAVAGLIPGDVCAQGGEVDDNREVVERTIIDARKALGDGLPQVAAVKTSRLLEMKGLSGKDRTEVASLAVEAWIRAREGGRARQLMDENEVDDEAFWSAQALVLAGEFDAAAAAFGKYAEMGDKADDARLALAFVLMADGREGQARTELKEVRGSADPVIARCARLLFNELELVVGRSDSVLQRLSREEGGKIADVQYLRARGLLQLGEMAKAEALIRDLLTLPNIGVHMHDAAVVLGAESLLGQQKADEALRMLVQFLDKAQDSDFWHEAFELLNRCRVALHAEEQIPLAVANWVSVDTAPARRAYAIYWISRWLDASGRKAEALGMIEVFMQLHPGHRNESEAMRLAMRLNGELRADSRVLGLARLWRERYGGGGESLVDFITGGIFFARGDLIPALAAFRRSADTAENLAERRRALQNAAVTAVRAGEMAVYQTLLSQIEVTGAATDGAAPDGVPQGSAAASLELDRALQMAAQADAAAEVEIQKFISTHPEHPRWAEAQVARAELALLDVPPRVKDAAVSLQAAMQKKNLSAATRERIDYVTVWLREAEGNLQGVAEAGLAFLKQWPASTLADQVRMKAGEAFYRLQAFPDARTQFELLASEHPGSPYADAALFFAGKAAMELMTPEGLQRAIEIWGDLAEHGGPMAMTARFQQALAKRREGLEKDALSIIDTLLADKRIDEEMRMQAQCQRIELQLIMGREDPKLRESAAAAARALKDKPGLNYLWKGRIGALLTQAMQDLGRNPEALEACYDIVNAGIDNTSGPSNPAEFYWFYWAGFRAVTLLEASKQWEAAAKMAETLAKTAGDRAGEAKELATRIRMEHFLWDATPAAK